MPDDQETTQTESTTDFSPTVPSDTPETAPEPQNAPTDGFDAESTNKPRYRIYYEGRTRK